MLFVNSAGDTAIGTITTPKFIIEELRRFQLDARSVDFPAAQRAVKRPHPRLEYKDRLDYVNHYHSASAQWMTGAIMALIWAHEYAHVEQRACGGVTSRLSETLKPIVDEYIKLTCHRPRREEVEADLRGIELALGLVPFIMTRNPERDVGLPLRDWSADVELRAIRQLHESPYSNALVAYKIFAEYELVFAADPAMAPFWLAREPLSGTSGRLAPLEAYDEVMEFYRKLAFERASSLKTGRGDNIHHMAPAARSAVILGILMNLVDRFDKNRRSFDQSGARLEGWIRGEIGALAKFCPTAASDPEYFSRRVRELTRNFDAPPPRPPPSTPRGIGTFTF